MSNSNTFTRLLEGIKNAFNLQPVSGSEQNPLIRLTNSKLMLTCDEIVEAWSYALEIRKHGTEAHIRRVTALTIGLARKMGMAESDIAHARRGVLLHDIGEMSVPDSILLKDGPLLPSERVILRRHPQYAYDMLSSIDYLRPALDIPYCHHERWDGTGYPRGLKGEAIPLAARIFSVVDTWDALRTDRPFREAWSDDSTWRYLREQVNYEFDPAVVRAFSELWSPTT